MSKEVEQYLESLPPERRAVLEHLRQVIRKAAPHAEECISYMMPTFKYMGMLCSYAAFKDHYSFFPGGVVENFKAELAGFKTSKGTIQFTDDKPLPDELVTRIIAFGIERNMAKQAARKAKKKG